MTAPSQGPETEAQGNQPEPPPRDRSWIEFDVGLRNQDPSPDTRQSS